MYSPWQLRSLKQQFSLCSFCADFADSLYNLGALTFRSHNLVKFHIFAIQLYAIFKQLRSIKVSDYFRA